MKCSDVGVRGRRSRIAAMIGKGPDGRGGPWSARLVVCVVIGALLACALVPAIPKPAVALSRGELEYFPGGESISNFRLPDQRWAYCVERQLGVPTGGLAALGEYQHLPGREGLFHSYGSPEGMRQINYLIDRHGQTANPWRAAVVQLAIWRIRATAGGSESVDYLLVKLGSSEKGRRLMAESDALMAKARIEAIAPVPGKAITGVLEIEPLPAAGTEAAPMFRLSYPAGTNYLEVVGGTFSKDRSVSAYIDPSSAGSVEIRADFGSSRIRARGEWESQGAPGWASSLHLFSSRTSGGTQGQRLAVAAGEVQGRPARGDFPAVLVQLPTPPADPLVRTEAQATAEIGGTAADVLFLEERPGTHMRVWPDATVEFRAYLDPELGEAKVDENWVPRRTEPINPESGELALEQWTAAELEGLSERERCTAQLVSEQTGIPLAGDGPLRSLPVPVRGAGRIHWVERIVVGGKVVHEGQCGITEETTVIERPRLSTSAKPEVSLGSRATDTAIIEGPVTAQAGYLVKFEAFRGGDASSDASESPTIVGPKDVVCDAEHRIYESENIPVTGPGRIESPGFTVRWEHSERIYWVATLLVSDERGHQTIDHGLCGETKETTLVPQPDISTVATETADVGEQIRDTALLTGEFSSEGQTRWEVSFEGYSGPEAGEEQALGEQRAKRAASEVCARDNRRFVTAAIPVTGPGRLESPAVVAQTDAVGEIWWVETLFIVEDGVRKPVLRGKCGMPQEITRVTGITLETQADPVAIVGGGMSDTARLSGRFSNTPDSRYELEFIGYRGTRARGEAGPPRCDASTELFRTERIGVDGPGNYRSPEVFVNPDFGTAVHWVASLRYQRGNAAWVEVARGKCGELGERTTIQRPRIRTESSGNVVVGAEISDRAIVAGLPPRREGVEFLVRFTAYLAGQIGELACTPEQRVEALSDENGQPIVNGEARSVARTTTEQHIGAGGFVARVVLRANGKEWMLAEGNCGDAAEAIAIRPRTPRLPDAGAPGGEQQMAVAGALAAGLGGAILLGLRLRRRRAVVGGPEVRTQG